MASFDILHLLAQLLDGGLQPQPGGGQRRGGGFAAQRVGLAVELLHQEVEAAADGGALGDQGARRGDVAGEPVQFLAHVGARGQQSDFLGDAFLRAVRWSRAAAPEGFPSAAYAAGRAGRRLRSRVGVQRVDLVQQPVKHAAQPFAFGGARADQRREGLLEAGLQPRPPSGPDRPGRRCRAHDARKSQQRLWPRRRAAGNPAGQLNRELQRLLQRGRVGRQMGLRSRRMVRLAVTLPRLRRLAARSRRTGSSSPSRGQAETQIEPAPVHAAQFPGPGEPCGGASARAKPVIEASWLMSIMYGFYQRRAKPQYAVLRETLGRHLAGFGLRARRLSATPPTRRRSAPAGMTDRLSALQPAVAP